MTRRVLIALFVVACSGIVISQDVLSVVRVDRNEPSPSGVPGVVTEDVATGLVVPWAMAFAPDGRLFVTERRGRVRVIDESGLRPVPVIDMTAVVVESNESGMHGIAVDPNFEKNRYLYVYHGYRVGVSIRNRVVRLIENDNRATLDSVLLQNIPGAGIHNGGRIKFGPDGLLYVGTGDANLASSAQNLGSVAGKILRMNPDGSAPEDNPFYPGSPLIYSYGHRNVQGFAWDSSGQMYETEHGPSRNDEVNIIYAGLNYGWPTCVGTCGDPRFVDPIRLFSLQTAAPAGATFYNGEAIPMWTGSLFFGTMGFPGNPYARHVHRILFDGPGGTEIIEEDDNLWRSQFGRIRDVIEGPDGFLYFSNSNRDGRGGDVLRPGDDRIVRVRPE